MRKILQIHLILGFLLIIPLSYFKILTYSLTHCGL